MELSDIITLLTGVALFLFGMSLMGEGLKGAAGERLERLLNRLTDRTYKGILLGAGATAVIQSSSATSVMAVNFVNVGMMRSRQAIGIILGAILGTSVTGWLICLSQLEGGGGWVSLLSASTLTGLAALTGILLRMLGKKIVRSRDFGNILLGFAVLMTGMDLMSGAVAPLQESETFLSLLTVFSNPLVGILVGAAFAAVLQSASAAVGVLQSLTLTGAINFSTALPLLMGISIGAALPVLLSAVGASAEGKRTAISYPAITVLGAAVCGGAYAVLQAVTGASALDTATMDTFTLALVNTLFRLGTVLTVWPLTGVLDRLLHKLVKGAPGSPASKNKTGAAEDDYPLMKLRHTEKYTEKNAG